MAHGGARKGAGRKTLARTLKSKALSAEIRDAAAKRGVPMPLEIMLEAIGQVYRGDVDGKRGKGRNALAAFGLAKECAPYLHPKLQAMDAKVSGDLTIEVVRFCADTTSE